MSSALLSLRGVGLQWPGRLGRRGAVALDGIDMDLFAGEALALVGESGSGKTTLGRIASGLLRPDHGEVLLHQTPYRSPMPLARRAKVQTVFQDTLGALNPRLSIGRQLAEPLIVHGARHDRDNRIRAALSDVDLSPSLLDRFPGQLSGGQRQRVLIARALILDPEVLICDEPVSALDVSVQARVLGLLHRLMRARDLTLLFISHDLRIVRQLCNRVAVLYRGRIVETGTVARVLERPAHPYTRALIAALPRDTPGGPALDPPGRVTGFGPTGCAYAPLCPMAETECTLTPPRLNLSGPQDGVACHRVEMAS